jgi:hypothetical protein
MVITLTEALRIKNELSNIIKTLNYGVHQSSFGKTVEDGEVVSQDVEKFENVEASLIRALGYSEELNGQISDFNRVSAVDVTVRKMQNAKLLLDIYTRNLDKTKPKTNKRFENLGTVRKSIEIVYTPTVTAKSMKDRISSQKSLIRNFQTQIEKANQTSISVSFEYADLESLVG